jgi:alpha-glucosidase (family GH31 glycosyl hydrolase)
LNEFRDSLFDLSCTETNAWSIALGTPPNLVPGCDRLDCYFLSGPPLRTIHDSYPDLTGRTPLLPRWSLGYLHICHFDQVRSSTAVTDP